ncbi:MAG: DUF2911 domain-containing protein [Candidatus Eisenbacteria bacterium]
MRPIRTVVPFLAAALAVALCAPAHCQLKTPRLSPGATLKQTIGTTDLTVVYSRPGVKGRSIWGTLVPYDKPWRTGANEATDFTTADDIMVEGKALPAGTYAFLTIPGKDTWTVVFSKQKDMWGAFDYKESEDVVRATVTPVALSEPQEWMEITIDPTSANTAELAVRWEKLKVPVKFSVDVNGKVLKDARAAIAAAKPDDWRTPWSAANWAFDNNASPDEAKQWAAKALAVNKNPRTLQVNARIAQKAGKQKEAAAQMAEAITLAKADKEFSKELTATYEKTLAEWSAKK